MAVCRTCGQEWPDSMLNCPHDGTSLQVTETAPPPGEDAPTMPTVALPQLSRSEPILDAPGTRVGDYVLGEVLGIGGMAVVYAAEHSVIGKRAAIKVLARQLDGESSAVARFIREARAVNTIAHPNIVEIFDFGRLEDGRWYLAMERLEGNSLDTFPMPLTVEKASRIVIEVCRALEAAHERGVVHRDLKPGNVFVGEGATLQVKLLDFGIARSVDQRDAHTVTQVGTFVGTPAYASPEQIHALPPSPHSDIYSLGVMLFELVTGSR